MVEQALLVRSGHCTQKGCDYSRGCWFS